MFNRFPNLRSRILNVVLCTLHGSGVCIFLFVLTACLPAHAADSGCLLSKSLPPSELGQPQNINELQNQLYYYECSGAYQRDFHQVIEDAISYVVSRVKQGGKLPLALILDIDETSLSNWEEIKVNQFAFFKDAPCEVGPKEGPRSRTTQVIEWMVPVPGKPCGDDSWKRSANLPPIKDTLNLFKVARQSNVAVFFISGREYRGEKDQIIGATEANLRKAGYSDWTGLILKPANRITVEQFKTAQRQKISEHYTIIANVGDQYSDLRGGFAERTFKLPNPFYFLP